MDDAKTFERDDGVRRATYEARDLRTLVDGSPIPYVSTWTPEIGDDALKTRIDTRVSKSIPVLCDDIARGVGRVILGVMNTERQRRVVLNHWCQICGEPLGKNGYAPEIYSGEAEIIPPQTRRHFRSGKMYDPWKTSAPIMGRVLPEPPSCAKCLISAMEFCPAVVRAVEAGAGVLTLPRGSCVILSTIHQTPGAPRMITYLKIVPIPPRIQVRTADEFRASVR